MAYWQSIACFCSYPLSDCRPSGSRGRFSMRVFRKLAALLAMACLATASCASRAQSISTFHNGSDRAGAYVVPGLTYAAAGRLHPDPAFHATLSGEVYAQPLYWKPAGAPKGLIIVATEQN